jgi:mevalonate kinase
MPSYTCGKIILGGEHAVVYGCPAIAIAIDCGMKIHVTNSYNNISPVLNLYDHSKNILLSADLFDKNESILKKALWGLVEIFGKQIEQTEIRIDSYIPSGSGLGSSSAITVGALKEILRYLNQQVSESDFLSMVMKLEKIFHGNPSGIDCTTIINKGIVWFEKKQSDISWYKLHDVAPLEFIVAIKSPHIGTSNAVKALSKRMEQNKQFYESIFFQIQSLIYQMKDCLIAANLRQLGSLMDLNHQLLMQLGVSTEELDDMCSLAKKAGALGAKMTGAGGGGAIIALVENNSSLVKEAFIEMGCDAFLVSSL